MPDTLKAEVEALVVVNFAPSQVKEVLVAGTPVPAPNRISLEVKLTKVRFGVVPPEENSGAVAVTLVTQVAQVKCEPEVPLPPKGESAVTEVK